MIIGIVENQTPALFPLAELIADSHHALIALVGND